MASQNPVAIAATQHAKPGSCASAFDIVFLYLIL